MIIDGIDLNKVIAEKARKYLAGLLKNKEETRIEYPDGRIYDGNDTLISEEPTQEQKDWVEFRLLHPSTWLKCHENKLGDDDNWQ
jgi:hypothetical protein